MQIKPLLLTGKEHKTSLCVVVSEYPIALVLAWLAAMGMDY